MAAFVIETPVSTTRRKLGVSGDAVSNQHSRAWICMIAYTNYPTDARVRREAETLAADGFQVTCLTTRNGTKQARYVLHGVEVRELSVPKYRGKSTAAYIASYVRFLISSSAACLRLLANRQLDVVHVHNLPDFLVFAGLLPRVAGKKVVLDVHDSVPETFATKFPGRPMFHKALCLEERVSARVAHRVICVNHLQRDTLVARGIPGSKTFISMNVPDPKIFAEQTADRRPKTAQEPFNLVYHGTMAERLGVDLIIRAVERLRGRIPQVRLHLWGSGDDIAAFQHLAWQLRLDGIVHFNHKGFPLQELPRELASMDVGVVGNRGSVACDLMLPVKLMEYVSLGIPTVAPRLRTIQHYFSEDTVAFYEVENVESMADAIFSLYATPELRSRQVALAREFLRKYGWQSQGAELIDLYREIMEN